MELKKNLELMLAIFFFVLLGSLCLAKKTSPSQTCFLKRKKIAVGRVEQKSRRVDDTLLGRKNVRVSLF